MPESRRRKAAGGGERVGRAPSERGAASPAALALKLCGVELAHPVINASGTFDAIAARHDYGDPLL